MDNMQKGFLIAGGLLLLGFLGYTIFGKKEEEEIEDAEYYIVVETKQAKDDTEAQQQVKVTEALVENLPLKVSNDTVAKQPIKEASNVSLDEKEITTFLKKKEVPLVNETKEEALTESQKPALKTKDNHTEINEMQGIEAKEVRLANDEFPLTLGSKGQRVWNLKVYLLKNHGAGGIVTNVYDGITAERVKRFLKVDQVSEQLYKKLNMESTRKKKKHATTKKKY